MSCGSPPISRTWLIIPFIPRCATRCSAPTGRRAQASACRICFWALAWRLTRLPSWHRARDFLVLGKRPGSGVPTGIRTPVASVKGMCPRPLDDGDAGLKSNDEHSKFGGARRDRTADLLHAMQALSQLSYGPITRKILYFKAKLN